jgi:hypothetical protein
MKSATHTTLKSRVAGRRSPAATDTAPVTAKPKPPITLVELPGRKNIPAKPEYATFAKLLRGAMLNRKMNASDLARAIWGTTTDPRGYEVAKNRDRVGAYLAGTGYPSRETLPKLCEAVGLDPSLIPMPTRSSAPREFAGTPDVTITLLTEHPGMCSMYIRKVIPVDIGMQIMTLVNSFNANTDILNVDDASADTD